MKRLIIILIVLFVVFGFFLFTEPGLDILQGIPDSNRGASWAPFAYYYISRLHSVVGRHERSIEICGLIQKSYWKEMGDASYIENEYGMYYVPAALYYEGVGQEALGDVELAEADKRRAKGDDAGADAYRLKAQRYYANARECFLSFTDNFNLHELYPKANRRLNIINELKSPP